jgi:hypothetical protein
MADFSDPDCCPILFKSNFFLRTFAGERISDVKIINIVVR